MILSILVFITVANLLDIELYMLVQGMYKLSCTLLGHVHDVKSVVAVSDSQIVSGSRDGTVRVWNRNELVSGNNWDSGVVIHKSDRFVNCVCFDDKENLVYYGGQNAIVKAVSTLCDANQGSTYVLAGHVSNICGIEARKGWIISSSWDKTARVWYGGELKYELRGHSGSVLHALVLAGEKRFLTASADKSIKLWEGSNVLKSFENIHSDVVRCLAVSPDNSKFLSCSNDTTVKLSDMNGRILKVFRGHESFVYCVKFLGHDKLVSCGEDRSVRIWSIEGDILQVIRLPAISIWAIDVLDIGDIVVGSSDNTVRVFTCSESRFASEKQIKELQDEVSSTAMNSGNMGFDETQLSPYEILSSPGKKEGQVVVVKSSSGVIEAYQYSAGQWSKIGDVIDSSSNTNQKIEFEGKLYDYVFDVDIQEGAPVLKLPINVNDNPYEVADKFIELHELPSSYRSQIINFILENTRSTSSDKFFNSSQHELPRPRKILPVTIYLQINKFNPDSLFNGIAKLNSTEHYFDDDDLAALATGLHNSESSYELLYTKAVLIESKWKTKTPAFDIMRLIVHKLPSADSISKFVDTGFDSKDPLIVMLAIRILVNSFSNEIWGSELMNSTSMYESVFELIDSDVPKSNPQQQKAYAISIATLIYNYTVLAIKKHNLGIVTFIADVLNNKYGPSSFLQESEEASYRLLVSYGNLTTLEPSLGKFASSLSWVKQVMQRYGTLMKFQDIFNDI